MNLDKDEIDELWNEITPKLYGYLVNTLRDSATAEDILQTTWIKAIESLSGYNERGRFSAWIFSIARNEMRMYWRKKGREVRYDPLVHDIPSESQNEENVFYVERFIKKLSFEDQELIRLRYIADLSLGEMAKIMKINPVTVRVKMHRALGRARILFKQQTYE